MKKFLSFCFATLIFASSLFAQQNNVYSSDGIQQVVIPKNVFVGDRAQLRYTFNNPVDLFEAADKSQIHGDVLTLDPEYPAFLSADESFTVQEVLLVRNGLMYTLEIYFVPWRPGKIDIAPFDLSACCRKKNLFEQEDLSAYSAESLAGFVIDLQPFFISSIAQRTDSFSIRPPASPLLLPGTSYILWTVIIVLILLLVLLALVLVKFKAIMSWILLLKQKLIYLYNVRSGKKALQKLLKEKISDTDFARSWQKIVRDYLSFRFDRSFASVTSGRIAKVISDATGNMLSGPQEDAVFALSSLFVRTDYIMFAQNSVDSRTLPLEEHQAAFAEGEKADIVRRTLEAIAGLETNGESENDGV